MVSKPGVRRDDDGFEDVDDYFDLGPENMAPAINKPAGLAKNIAATATSFSVSSLKGQPEPAFYEEYEQPVEFDDVGGEYDNAEGGEIYTGHVDVHGQDQEVSFGTRVVQSKEKADAANSTKAKRAKRASKSVTQRLRQRAPAVVGAAEKYGTAVAEDGRRRTLRKPMEPLSFWKNEKVKYGRRNSLGKPYSQILRHSRDCRRGETPPSASYQQEG